MFQTWWIKKRKENPLYFQSRCCLEVVFHCTGRNLSNNNNKLLKLGLKRFRCTFFIEICSKNCRFNPETRESIFLFFAFFLRNWKICFYSPTVLTLMLNAVCLLQTVEIIAYSFHWTYSIKTPDQLHISFFPQKMDFSENVKHLGWFHL